MNAIVIHSVAANGGDELLLRTLIDSLKRDCGIETLAVTSNNIISFPYIPIENKFLNKTILGSPNECNNFVYRFLKKFNFLPYRIRENFSLLFDKDYKKFKILSKELNFAILTPGGFIHDYYGLEPIYDLIFKLYSMGMKIIIFAQSVGPFETEKNKVIARKIFDMADQIIVRERYSEEYIKALYPNGIERLKVFTDIAFNYNRKIPVKKGEVPGTNKILLNFRDWHFNNINTDEIVEKGANIALYLFEKGYFLEFLSTCQGVNGYTNDSHIGEKILKKAQSLNSRVQIKIHKKKFEIDDYLDLVKDAKYYIGMRMHSAIMPILENVPALNIGYEHKTKGVYETIGLNNFSCSIHDETGSIIQKIEWFLAYDYDQLKGIYKDALIMGRNKSKMAFASLKDHDAEVLN